MNQPRPNRQAFTLVEIMIVVSFIGLLAVLMVPSFLRVRKQAQGKRIVNDARVIDGAVDAWAFERSKADGDPVDVRQAGQYTKSGVISSNDVLGNCYGIGPVGPTQVVVSGVSKTALAGVVIEWGPY